MAGASSSSSPSPTAFSENEESVKKSFSVTPRRMATRSTVTYQKFEGKQVNIVTDSSTESESESEFEEGDEEEEGNSNGVTQPSTEHKSNGVSQPLTDSYVELQECTGKISGICMAEDELPYLTGKPCFDTVLEEKHFRRPLYLPRKISQRLPHGEIPLTLLHHGKKWDLIYHGHGAIPRLYGATWRSFLKENGLREGDALVFQLMECSRAKVVFKVQILKCDVPPELLAYIQCNGEPTNTIKIE